MSCHDHGTLGGGERNLITALRILIVMPRGPWREGFCNCARDSHQDAARATVGGEGALFGLAMEMFNISRSSR
jgi:hypothetical protein